MSIIPRPVDAMAIRNDDGRAELAARLDQLYGIVDESPLLGLDEAEKEQLVAGAAADILYKDSFLPKLARSELERNLREGLSAADPTGMGGNNYFEPFRLTKAGYERAKAALIEANRSIDSETFHATSDYNEEVLDRAAFALIEHPYVKSGEGRERMFMADAGLLDGFAGAYEKARAVYLENVPEARTNVLEPPRPRTGPRREGVVGWVRDHWKGMAITGIVAAAGAYGIYGAVKSGVDSQDRVNQLKSHGGDDASARGFDAKYGLKLAGKADNRFNSSVLDLYDVHVDNATLASIVESGARVSDGSVWQAVDYVAGHLGTPQYMPKTAREAGMLSMFVHGVEGITDHPKELKGFSHKSMALIDVMGSTYAANAADVREGLKNVARYEIDCENKGLINLDRLNGSDLERAILPLALCQMGIVDGHQYIASAKPFMDNTTPRADLGGLTALQWQGEQVRQILKEKGARYDAAVETGKETLAPAWPEALKSYLAGIDNLPDKDLIKFVYGCGGLVERTGYPNHWTNAVVDVAGAHQPYYAQIVGMHFGMPVKTYAANYPTDGSTYHSDMSVMGSDGKYHGPFSYPSEMAKSYIGTGTTMKYYDDTAYEG